MSIWFVYVCLTDTLIGNGVNWFLTLDGAKPSLSLNFPVCSEDSIPISVREVSPTRLGLPCAKTWLQLEDWDFGTQVKGTSSKRSALGILLRENGVFPFPFPRNSFQVAEVITEQEEAQGPTPALRLRSEAPCAARQAGNARSRRWRRRRRRWRQRGPAAALNEAVVRRTQDSLGRVIRKPPLRDRLLSKPPFRYLHAVIPEVIRVTGFMKGLYTDFELKSDNVKEEAKQIPVDQLGQKVLEKKGVSWNKKYRKQYGALRKYLQNHPQIFQFSPDENKVGLKAKHKLPFKSDSRGQDLQSPPQKSDVQWNSEKEPTRLRDSSAGCHWFDLNGSKVHPIKEKDIEKQFQERMKVHKAHLDILGASFVGSLLSGGLIFSNTKGCNIIALNFQGLPARKCKVFAVLNELKRFIFTRAATTFTNSKCGFRGLKAIWVYTEGNMGWRSVLEPLSERPSPKCLTGFCVTGPVEVEVFGCLDKICCRSGNHCMRLTVLREDEGRGIESASVPLGSDGCKFSHAPKTRKVHLKDMTVRIYIDVGFLPRNNGSVFIALFYITIFEHLNLALCRGEEETLMQIKDDHFQAAKCFEGLEKDMKAVLHSICQSCVEETNKQTKSDNWHWRRIDWCYEAGEASQENATLKELNVCRGDTLVITEELPAKGFLKIPVWWLKPSSHKKHGENAQDQVNGMTCKMDALQVSPAGGELDRFLKELIKWFSFFQGGWLLKFLKKCFFFQAMTLPCCPEQIVPLPSFLRAWTVDSKRPGKLLRNNKQRLNDYKLGARVEICLGALQKEEHLGPQELLLRVQMGIPGERDYYGSTALVWDISKECTTWALRQRVASHYGLPVDKLEIAKYFPERLEWLPISSWTQQMSKRKRKKKQESLQSAPYHLKDGNIIGVKETSERTYSQEVKSLVSYPDALGYAEKPPNKAN
ncbi:LOW QUALITY PROTEIN: ubiquitin carboxyl-terminal hydrolase 40-like [Sarcoramphus papa]